MSFLGWVNPDYNSGSTGFIFSKIYYGPIYTITADNGKKFGLHEEVARKLKVFVYFAKPCHSRERGANENTNGLIRQYFLKGTDFRDITQEQGMRVRTILNSRLRKRLGYMTPKEKYKSLTNKELDAVTLSA